VDETEYGGEDDIFRGVEEADWTSPETNPAEQDLDSTLHGICNGRGNLSSS
jgi:hypothetical protein